MASDEITRTYVIVFCIASLFFNVARSSSLFAVRYQYTAWTTAMRDSPESDLRHCWSRGSCSRDGRVWLRNGEDFRQPLSFVARRNVYEKDSPREAMLISK